MNGAPRVTWGTRHVSDSGNAGMRATFRIWKNGQARVWKDPHIRKRTCLVPRHPLRFVPGHPLQFSVRNREYKASGPPSTAGFADPIPESKCDSSTPTLAVRPPADKPARRPERG